MTKTIGIIGCSDTSERIAMMEAMLKEKGIDNIILVGTKEPLPESMLGEVVITPDETIPELPKPSVYRLEAPPMEIINKSSYQEIKDGRTLRRERRKRERLNKR